MASRTPQQRLEGLPEHGKSVLTFINSDIPMDAATLRPLMRRLALDVPLALEAIGILRDLRREHPSAIPALALAVIDDLLHRLDEEDS